MRFRPCIDIHNGIVKQIVGSSLKDENDQASENYVANHDASWFAKRYKQDGLQGGHVILLNPQSSPYYEKTKKQALEALAAYPEGMQIGGGINAENAAEYIENGASHVIVTSYVFKNGEVNYENLDKLVKAVGKSKIVLDLSCRKKNNDYYIVTDRWQTFTNIKLNEETMEHFSKYCDEFLIHGVDVEGKGSGMEEELVKLLSKWEKNPITYAGGIASVDQIDNFKKICDAKLDFTIGSALDIFGGHLSYQEIVAKYNE